MIRSVLTWMWDRPVRSSVTLGLGGAIALNLVAWMHARAMTHFTTAGERTASIEDLGFLDRLRTVAFGVTVPKPVNRRSPADHGLAFTTHRLTASDGTGLEAWLVPAENARAVVVAVHGYASAKCQVLPAARVLHRRGCDVLMLDMRAAGGSDGHRSSLGYEEAHDVAAAAAFAARLRPDLPLVLYGYSMGAAAVTRAIAEEGVAPAAAVLEGSFARLLDTVANRFRMMGLPAFPAAHLLVFWGGLQLGFDGFAHNPVDYAAMVRCPVLLLAGEHDQRAPPAGAQAIRAAMAGPAEMHLFVGAGHEPPVVTRESEWQNVVALFLKRHVITALPAEKRREP